MVMLKNIIDSIGKAKTPEEELLKLHWEMARRDPIDFFRFFCFSCDSHDSANPIKPFPWERPHIQHVARLWQAHPLIIEVKSRQMFQTWEYCGLYLWDCIFNRGRLNFLQSKKEEDAIGDENTGDGLLGRCKFILSHMPGRKLLFPRGSYVLREKKVQFIYNHSTLHAIPEGGEMIRTHTASGLLSDEAAFQDELNEAYTSAIPCIRGGGRITLLSTPNPGPFQLIYEDRLNQYV